MKNENKFKNVEYYDNSSLYDSNMIKMNFCCDESNDSHDIKKLIKKREDLFKQNLLLMNKRY